MVQANTGIAYGNLFKYIQMIISDCQNSQNFLKSFHWWGIDKCLQSQLFENGHEIKYYAMTLF